MSAGNFTKAVGAKLDYTIGVQKLIAPSRVHHALWSTDDPALVVGTGQNGMPAPSNTDTDITVHLAGGRPGHTHRVTALVTTPEGRVYDEEFQVAIKGELAAPHQSALTGVEPSAPPTEAQIALQILTRTAIQTAFILPTLWVGGKTFKVKGLEGWRLVGIALSVSSALTVGALLIEALRKRT